jgi:dual specificity MAP kinase phosphatase
MQRRMCRWNKPVIVYGDEKLRKDHPAVAFLAKENRCASLGIFKEGCGRRLGRAP